jgi:hypothetical protein
MQRLEIVTELRRIAEQYDGKLRPSDVIKAARPVSSPLHDQFQWDDTEAAREYRLWQARQLIRVTVEYIGAGEEKTLTRVFVSLTSDREQGGYRVTADVYSNPSRRRELLNDALEELKRVERKYSHLKELTEVFAAIRRADKRTGATA